MADHADHKDTVSGGCPQTDRSPSTWRGKWPKHLFPLIGVLSLIWFLVRVIPKPNRAAYPCMRVTAPLAAGFVIWLIGLCGSIVALRTARNQIRHARYIRAALCLVAAGVTVWFGFSGTYRPPASAKRVLSIQATAETDPANAPMGDPKGYNPGRVVWVHDPDATDWGGPASGESCWESGNIDQAVVDDMMSRAIRWLAETSTVSDAWDALFRHFNTERENGDRGYEPGEKVVIKVNLTDCNAAWGADPATRDRTRHLDKAGDTNPQVILALLRQLVNIVGIDQTHISVGDTVSFFPNQWYAYLSSEFPNVNYLDHYGFTGRTAVHKSTVPFYWSTEAADDKLRDYVPLSYAEADYLINIPVLKVHAFGGITVCAKNHYGSLIRAPQGHEWGDLKAYYNLHQSLPCDQPGRGFYRALVDLMGHTHIGGKTLLYLIDALYAGQGWLGIPYLWNMAPFNGDWPSSLFVSQDPVAIDSVAYDFLYAEWPDYVENGVCSNGTLAGGAQDYLHEAAQADDPPSGTFYDPEDDGIRMVSLGVHEHWNNAIDKEYSRNLGTADGIELTSSDPLACEGDFDETGDVDDADLGVFASFLGRTDCGCASDFDEDCDVDGSDLAVFAADFGRTNCPQPP